MTKAAYFRLFKCDVGGNMVYVALSWNNASPSLAECLAEAEDVLMHDVNYKNVHLKSFEESGYVLIKVPDVDKALDTSPPTPEAEGE